MADELRIKVVLDSGEVKEGFLAVEKQADKTAKSIGKSFDKKGDGLNSLSEGLEAVNGGLSGIAATAARSLGPIGAVALGFAAATASLFKFALAGEQVNAVNAQFTNVAKGAGLAADQFGASIITATQGLIDDEDALQIATKGIIALGDAAKELPAILDASRSVSRALGKDFKSTFEDLSTFVENGNARVLRQFGIILDLEKAYAAAAKSIGVATSALTEQQKQQIRANLILEEVPKKFGAAAQSVTPLKDAFDRLKVSASNSIEALSVSLNNSLGPSIERTLTALENRFKQGIGLKDLASFIFTPGAALSELAINSGKAVVGLDNAALSVSGLKDKISKTTNDITELNKKLEDLGKQKDDPSTSSLKLAAIPLAITEIEKKTKSAQLELQNLYSLLGQKLPGSDQDVLPTPEKKPFKIESTTEQDAQILADKKAKAQELTTFLNNEELKRINNSVSLKQLELSNETNAGAQAILLDDILNKQLEAQKLQSEITIDGIKKQFKGNELIDVQNRNAAILAAEASFEDQLLLIKKKAEADKLAIQKRTSQQQLSNLQASFGAIATLQESSNQELATIGKAAAIANATIDGYAAVQKALSSAPPPFNFAIAALVGVAAAQNIAKIASVGGGGSGGAASSFDPGSGGGGIAASPSPSTELTQPQDLQRQEVGTSVSVVIQGDVLDSEESGSRIVSLINNAFDKKGVVINQGVMA